MKLYAPRYYKDFRCIADKCRHSCCIGWEIDVDGDTLEKYKALKEGYGREIVSTVDFSDSPCFKLLNNDRCPHLDERGLCRIITNVGEEYLCDICREHPRFYNDTVRGKEVGIGLSCEEAARIILSSDSYAEMILLKEDGDKTDSPEFDATPYREVLFSILSDSLLLHKDKLLKIYNTFGFSYPLISNERARELISELEYLNEENKRLFLCYDFLAMPKESLEAPLERALAYFVYRHLSKAFDADEARAYLGFALFSYHLLVSCGVSKDINNFEDFVELARTVSEELEYSEDNTYTVSSEFI